MLLVDNNNPWDNHEQILPWTPLETLEVEFERIQSSTWQGPIKLTSSMPVMEKGGCWAMHAQNKKLNVS